MQRKIDLLNIDVYAENQSLYVRFDIIVDAQRDVSKISLFGKLGGVAREYSNSAFDYSDLKEDKTELADKNILRHLFHMQPPEPIGINSLRSELNETYHETLPYTHINVVYKMSNNPHVLINWLACLSIYVNRNRMHLPAHIQFSEYAGFDNFNSVTDMAALIIGDNCQNTIIRMVMEKIVAFKLSNPELMHYQEALADMGKLHDYYVAGRQLPNPRTLIECLSDQRRCSLFYDNQYEKLSRIEHAAQKDRDIILLAESMLFNEFLFMMELISTQNKIKFMEPSLEKKAHDEGRYNMNYTELQLIYFGEFHLFPDGRMGIINLDKNSAYQKSYAKGKHNFDNLHPELYHLANYLDVQFEPDCDFHQKNTILFTLECSPKLANLNLHLNANYSQTLFNVYNTWAFFTRIRLAGDNVFSCLPTEILDDIVTRANPTFQCINNKKQDTGFFRAVKLGKERGMNEHNVVIQRSLAS